MAGEFLDPSRWYTWMDSARRDSVPLARTFASQVPNDPSWLESTAIGPASLRDRTAAQQQVPDDPLWLESGAAGPAPPSGRTFGSQVPDDPWERAAYRTRQAARPEFGRDLGEGQQLKAAIAANFLPIGRAFTFMRQFPKLTAGLVGSLGTIVHSREAGGPTDLGIAWPEPSPPRDADMTSYDGRNEAGPSTPQMEPQNLPRFDKPNARHGFYPEQPDVPLDNRSGGEWAETQHDPRILSDATIDDNWIPGAQYAGVGHHWVPRKHWRDMRPETKKVFDSHTTGDIPIGVRDSLEEKTRYHQWDAAHRHYSDAVGDLISDFSRMQGIARKDFTPEHASQIIKLVATSQVPHIQDYREFILRLARMFKLRTGR